MALKRNMAPIQFNHIYTSLMKAVFVSLKSYSPLIHVDWRNIL